MATFNNTTKPLKDELERTIQPGSRIAVAADCFSMYAYQALKEQLESCADLRFVFTSPAFVKENAPRESREFYIAHLQREREQSLCGTELEVRLRNELKQKAVAKECADWIRRKARFKSNTTGRADNSFLVVSGAVGGRAYNPVRAFTAAGLGCGGGDGKPAIISRVDDPEDVQDFLQAFDCDWNDESALADVTGEVIDRIASVYKENAPELVYYLALRHVLGALPDGASGDTLPNEATGFMDTQIWKKLYSFQRDAAIGVISRLERYNGCILADSVGLGKTFTALAVIKYYEKRNKDVLVLCPKKLSENWLVYSGGNRVDNTLAEDHFRYDVLYHTDLLRKSGKSETGRQLDVLNWGNYALVVIDESHNFRNGIGTNSQGGEKENRYMFLRDRVIKAGLPTKVLMLSATPVNNRFTDLRNQLRLFAGDDPEEFRRKLGTGSTMEAIFKRAQGASTAWCKKPAGERTTGALLTSLDSEFFTLLDAVTIARSRKHIQSYADVDNFGAFPRRLPPISHSPRLTDLPNAASYKEVFDLLTQLTLAVYAPIAYVHESRQAKYQDGGKTKGLRAGRGSGLRRLMGVNLLKRMESSVHAFLLTARRVCQSMEETSRIVERFQAGGGGQLQTVDIFAGAEDEFDGDDLNSELYGVGKDRDIDLRDMDDVGFKRDIDADIEILRLLISMVEDITPEWDFKLKELNRLVRDKVAGTTVNAGNKKILIFTAFADTAQYLFDSLRATAAELGVNAALVTGSGAPKTSLPGFKPGKSGGVNRVLACFSPISKEKRLVYPDEAAEFDILIATDCVSEGQNLQDCDCCVNYDIHWNPTRIIQRFGRIDRIGSRNERIQLVNFWPDMGLDEYIRLTDRVRARMSIGIASATGTGEDNPIDPDAAKADLEYRTRQMECLRDGRLDFEDVAGGVSITDLGLNEHRAALQAYVAKHGDLARTPLGIHAVVSGGRPGVIFVLKSVNKESAGERRNLLHPYCLVYVGDDDTVILDHLHPKEILDAMRRLAKGKDKPDTALCKRFNKATKDGRDMRGVSRLLDSAVQAIVGAKEASDVESFFREGPTTFLLPGTTGLDDFELICFLVVM